MADDLKQPDAIENALLELEAAERARVFDRTPVDSRLLAMTEPVSRSTGYAGHAQRVFRLVPIAAAVGFAVIAGMWMLEGRPVSTQSPNIVVKQGGGIDEDDGCDGSILGCFSGPNKILLASCLTHDYDADGDVDLIDFSAYQVDCKRPAYTRQ